MLGPSSRLSAITARLTPLVCLLGALGFAVALLFAACPGCTDNLRPAVTLHVTRNKGTPPDASVVIDEQYIGPLAYVAARGVRLPEGEHRISVEKTGYFPWDRLVVAGSDPITLDVRLVPIPD
jgi:PEGA domain